ncbi:MAG: phycobilisome linker polypeptide [Microcystaceae cyanobacterium]
MLSRSSLVGTGNSPSANRVFLYEVKGLRQSKESDKNSYPIRRSGSVFIKVPYGRMNEEMLRINRLGGEIVNIQPLSVGDASEN